MNTLGGSTKVELLIHPAIVDGSPGLYMTTRLRLYDSLLGRKPCGRLAQSAVVNRWRIGFPATPALAAGRHLSWIVVRHP